MHGHGDSRRGPGGVAGRAMPPRLPPQDGGKEPSPAALAWKPNATALKGSAAALPVAAETGTFLLCARASTGKSPPDAPGLTNHTRGVRFSLSELLPHVNRADLVPGKCLLEVRFVARRFVVYAIRLNGKEVPLPEERFDGAVEQIGAEDLRRLCRRRRDRRFRVRRAQHGTRAGPAPGLWIATTGPSLRGCAYSSPRRRLRCRRTRRTQMTTQRRRNRPEEKSEKARFLPSWQFVTRRFPFTPLCFRSSMMRRVRFAPFTLCAVLTAILLAGPLPLAHAAIVYSGDVTDSGGNPSNPNTWTSSTNGIVGNTGTGTVTVDPSQGLLSNTCTLGSADTGIGTVTVNGNGTAGNATWTCSGLLTLGGINHSGQGTLIVTNGGLVNANGTGGSTEFIEGYGANSTGSLTVDGTGSVFNSPNAPAYLAYYNNGSSATVTIRNGGVANFNWLSLASGARRPHRHRVGHGNRKWLGLELLQHDQWPVLWHHWFGDGERHQRWTDDRPRWENQPCQRRRHFKIHAQYRRPQFARLHHQGRWHRRPGAIGTAGTATVNITGGGSHEGFGAAVSVGTVRRGQRHHQCRWLRLPVPLLRNLRPPRDFRAGQYRWRQRSA